MKSVDEINTSLETLKEIVADLPYDDKKASLTKGITELQDTLNGSTKNPEDIEKAYNNLFETVTDAYRESSGLDKSAFLIIADIVLMIGYGIAGAYRGSQKLYNSLVAQYEESAIQDQTNLKDTLQRGIESQTKKVRDVEGLSGNTDMLKILVQGRLSKDEAQLKTLSANIDERSATKGLYQAAAESRGKQANSNFTKASEHYTNLSISGKIKMEKIKGALSDLKNSVAEKLGFETGTQGRSR